MGVFGGRQSMDQPGLTLTAIVPVQKGRGRISGIA